MTVPPTPANRALRIDLLRIADWVKPGSRVLDVGCGDGALLTYLARARGVDARGIELSQAGVNACVTQGLAVIQGDADTDLADYPDGVFDYAILSQTLQATFDPKRVLTELVRIGRHAIVSFPNFGHWKARLHLLLHGRMPMTDALTHQWWDTPNIHLCTIKDFKLLCRDLDIVVVDGIAFDDQARGIPIGDRPGAANLRGVTGAFLLRKR